ncbi:MAG: class I SAM-dependent methyltransferase [Dermatophilaceae bacterium]
MTKLSPRQRRLRSVWDNRVDEWADIVEESPGFAQLRERMLELAAPAATDRCLDLGAGAGFLTLPLAALASSVQATDLSAEMLRSLRADAERTGAPVTTLVADMAQLQLPASSFELIVSSYAMHYLTDVDKQQLLRNMHRWVVPGGRIVLADMMVGRKLDQHHREVFREKALAMLRRGPAGWWRLAKNVARIGSGKGRLRPCPPGWWVAAVNDAGFSDVRYEHIISEAGIVVGTRPL